METADHLLVTRARQGDRIAFGQLVELHQQMVYTLSVRMMKQTELAEEVAQDAFVKAWQQLPKFQEKSKFSTWLYRITYTTAVSALRKRQIEYATETEMNDHLLNSEGVEHTMDRLSQLERKHYIDLALAQLGEKDQVILTLFYLAENSTEEVAEITGQSVSNVKVRLMRGRQRLYKALESLLKDEVHSIL